MENGTEPISNSPFVEALKKYPQHMCFGGRYGELSQDMFKILKKVAEAKADHKDSWKKMAVQSRDQGVGLIYQQLVSQMSDALDFALSDCFKTRIMEGLNHDGRRLEGDVAPKSSDVHNWNEQLELLAEQDWKDSRLRAL